MKYLKLFEELTFNVDDWMKKHNLEYSVNPDGSVDVEATGYFFLNEELPIKINKYVGTLDIHLPKGARIKNFPNIVTGDFKLKANVDNLEGCPIEVGEKREEYTGYGEFSVGGCHLKTLKGAPKFIEGIICIEDNPCANDPMQLNYLPDKNVSEGTVFNKFYKRKSTMEWDEVAGTIKTIKTEREEGLYYKVKQKELDKYWDAKLQDEPTLFLKLVVNKDENSWFSNNISEKLYNKYDYLHRGNKADFWGFNK